jgi:hypothetical protein
VQETRRARRHLPGHLPVRLCMHPGARPGLRRHSLADPALTQKPGRMLAVFGGAWPLLLAAGHYHWAAGAGPCRTPGPLTGDAETHSTCASGTRSTARWAAKGAVRATGQARSYYRQPASSASASAATQISLLGVPRETNPAPAASQLGGSARVLSNLSPSLSVMSHFGVAGAA